MKGIRILVAMAMVGVAALFGATQLFANDQTARLVPVDTDAQLGPNGAATRLRGFEEVPAISSPGDGFFVLQIVNETTVNYRLDYTALQGNVSQAHLHLGQMGVNGGIVVFLCSNLGNGPAGTQLCPASGGISGSFNSSSLTPQVNQGIAAGELAEVLRAVRAGVVYANVHSDLFPGGEIRGQLIFTPSGPGGGSPGSVPSSGPGGGAPAVVPAPSGDGPGAAPSGNGPG